MDKYSHRWHCVDSVVRIQREHGNQSEGKQEFKKLYKNVGVEGGPQHLKKLS
jgi:hypothetical protein